MPEPHPIHAPDPRVGGIVRLPDDGARLHILDTIPELRVEGFPSIHLTVYWSAYDGVQPTRCLEGQALEFVERSHADRHPIPGHLLRMWDLALTRHRQ